MAHLEIKNLYKNYGSLQALNDLSFEVNAGEIFGFVGSNGAGKSTTMRIALGVLEATSGQTLLDGKPLDFVGRTRIGYMPEERGLYPKMKVGEQLVYLAQLHGMNRKAATASMEKWTDRLGISARRNDLVEALSLGNQQRVQLSAALVHEPEVLILDEPFSGLDPVAVDVMSGVLRERANAGAPVIFSSHQLDLVEKLCDKVGIIKAGQMVAVGTVEELQSRAGNLWEITLATPQDFGWLRAIPGIQIQTLRDTSAEFLVLTDNVEQLVLQQAPAHGKVIKFGKRYIPLADLFRDTVASSTESEK